MDEELELNGTMKETGEKKEQKKNDSSCNYSAEVVKWENYLSKTMMTVLLVESDPSTRRFIASLLKKCSYKVIKASDGLKAWEILKKKAADINLILTEVELPAISGFELVSLIMEDDICKNIPVIMMCSPNLVCMSLECIILKGAADFLIKPVRWNELTNLWQHVWRRHDVGSPLQNTTFPQEKPKTVTQDISANKQSSDLVLFSQKNPECSKKLSEEAQSTCTSPLSEAEDAYLENMQNASQKHGESTIERESTKHNDETGDSRIEQDHGSAETENKDEIFRDGLSRDNRNINTEILSNEMIEPSSSAIDLIDTFGNLRKGLEKNHCLDVDTELKLSSRRDFSGSSCQQAIEATEEWQILNHLNTCAFSRYGDSKIFQPLTRNSKCNYDESHKLSTITAGNYCHYGSSNQMEEDMTGFVIGQFGQIGPKLLNNQLLVDNGFPHTWTPKPICQKESSPLPSSSSSQSIPETHNSNQHCHHSNDSNYSCLTQNVCEKIDSHHVKHDSPIASQSVGYDFCDDASNNISSCGSDGSATSTVINSKNLTSSSDGGGRSYNSSDGFRSVDSHHSSQREAALAKYRLKRTERRSYEKKVRYQSRKRLAEQRPRVKGQFVRQECSGNHPIADGNVDP